MRKSKTMRAATLLLALVLITSCFVGGTFAKYITTANGGDSARVAKWGVTLEATNGGSFKTSYTTDDTNYSGTISASVTSTDAVVAPGTKDDTGISFKISGTPEVATKITISMTDVKDIYLDTYYPITYKVQLKLSEGTWKDVHTGKLSDIATGLASFSGKTYEPGQTLDQEYRLIWEWPFGDSTNNTNDTALGDLAAGLTVNGYTTTGENANASTSCSYKIEFKVEQID